MEDPRRLVTPMRALNASFALSVASFAALMILGSPIEAGLTPLDGTCLAVMIVAGLSYYVSLSIVAHRLNLSVITWVGLAFITAPIGPIIAYLMIQGRVSKARG